MVHASLMEHTLRCIIMCIILILNSVLNALTLKAPNKNCSRRRFFTFISRRKEGLIFHVNPLPSRDSLETPSFIFSEKLMKTYL